LNFNNKIFSIKLNRKLLLKITGYFNNNEVYEIDLRKAESAAFSLKKKSDKHPPVILIVARHYYQEISRSYPLGNKSEVRKLIKLEFEGQRVVSKIIKSDKGKTSVNIWIINAEVPQALVLVPESYLYSTLINSDVILQINSSPKQFITIQNGALHSQIANGLISNTANFTTSIGAPNTLKIVDIENTGVAGLFINAFNKVSLNSLLSFFVAPKIEVNKILLSKAILPAFCLGMFYVLASSVFVYGKKAYLADDIRTQRSEVNKVLSVNDSVDLKLAEYKAITQFLASKINIERLWFVMPDVFDNAIIKRLEFNQGRFVLYGEAERATTLLSTLNANQYVNDAQFDNPVRTNRGKEIFIASFTLNVPQLMTSDKDPI
jgi:hypothetical protein